MDTPLPPPPSLPSQPTFQTVEPLPPKVPRIPYWVAAAVLVLMLLGSANIIFRLRPSPNTTEPTPSTTPTPTATISDQRVMGPKETYLAVTGEIEAMETIEEWVAINRKYGSKSILAEIDEKNLVPPYTESELQAFAYFKTILRKVADTIIISEEINGNTATLQVSSTPPIRTSTVTLVNEGGLWKFEKESFHEPLPLLGTPQP